MKCLECGTENPDTAKFCNECAARLHLICPQCGTSNGPSSKYCNECAHDLRKPRETHSIDYSEPQSYTPKHLAEKILTSRNSIEGERKLVTILFADVANSTSMFENLDPEAVHEIMDGCFRILMDQIHRYEGSINQFRGDGVMALFGAPIAHEDHAQRACYASLSIQRSLQPYADRLKKDYGIDFWMRIGLNSGHVVVGAIGDDLRMDYTAQGDTANLASRMESNAVPGGVLVSKNTYRPAREFFEFESVGKIRLKGKQEPVEAYRLLKATDVTTRIAASSAKGLTPFVGRKREMETLEDAFEKARSGQGQVIGVVGEAGVGKSRLLLEFRNALPKGEYTFVEGQCLHFGSSMPYLPILDVLRSFIGVKEGEQEQTIRDRLNDKVLGLDSSLQTVIPPFQDLLSLAVEDDGYARLEPKQKREKTFEALRDLLVRGGRDRPIVLAVEDLHWIDKTTEEFLDYLIGWLPAAHILLLLLYRPEYTHPWGSKSYYAKIGVDKLSTGTSTELVQTILEGGDVAPELRELIMSRTSGNPLFMEELTHSLLENGSVQKLEGQFLLTRKDSEIQVPDTIQGIIAARMDRLEEGLKRIMQVAAVIGREFAFTILQAVTEMKEDLKSNLLNLQGLEFIYEKSLFPELEYIFRHALTQEVAYNSLLVKRRKEIHERIGRAIEQLYADRLEEFYEMLAFHYSKSADQIKAFQYLKMSGTKATRNHSLWEAFRFYKEAIHSIKSLPDTEENRRQLLEVTHDITKPMAFLGYPDDSLQILEEGRNHSTELGDRRGRVTFLSRIGHYHFVRANPVAGIRFGEECFRDSEEMQDEELMVAVGNELCGSYNMSGRHMGVIDVAPKIIRIIERTERQRDFFGRPFNPYVDLHGYCGMSMGLTGNFDKATMLCERGLAFAKQLGHLPSLGFVEACYSYVLFPLGNGRSVIEHARKAFEYSEEGQVPLTAGLARTLLGIGHYLLGELETAEEHMRQALELKREAGLQFFLGHDHRALGGVHLARGDFEKARFHAREALNLSLRNQTKENEGLSRILLGTIIGKTEQSKFDEALLSIMEGIEILEELRLRPLYAMGYVDLGQLYADTGMKDKALQNLKKAETKFQQMGMKYWQGKTREVLGRL